MKADLTAEFRSSIKKRTQNKRDDINHLETQVTFVIPPKNDIMRKHLLIGHKTHCMPRKQLPICCLEFFVYGQYEPVDKGKSPWITMA